MRTKEHSKFTLKAATIWIISIALVSILLSMCNSSKNTHNKNYGKIKNKTIKVKHKK
jgi:hypothetical protein